LSLSKALRRYISLPIVSDQSAQLVPGLSGDSLDGADGLSEAGWITQSKYMQSSCVHM